MFDINEKNFEQRVFDLAPDLVMTFPSENEINIAKSLLTSPDFKLHDPKNGNWIESCFSLIDGNHTAADIIEAAPEARKKEVLSILKMLQKHYLTEKHSVEVPQVSAFLKQRLAKNATAVSSYIDNMANKTVAIVGSGKYAKALIETIEHFPLANIHWVVPQSDLIDHLTAVSPVVNENKSIYYTDSLQDIEHKLAQSRPDFIILAEDFFDFDLITTVDRFAEHYDTKWMFSLIEGWNIDIGPCFVPSQSGGFNCWLQHSTRYHTLINLSATQKADIQKYQTHALNPAFINIASGLIANELSDLLGILPINLTKNLTLSLSKQTQFDMSAFHQEVEYTHKCQQCESCISHTLTKAS